MPVDAKAFDAFQTDPIGFMKDNMVLTARMGSKLGHAIKATLATNQTATAMLNGKSIKVYTLREPRDDEPFFESYYCDFSPGQIMYEVLSKEADFAFTYAMDGCTFGVGRPTPEGDVLVTHGNARGVTEGGNSQNERQRNFALQLHGGKIDEMLEPETYRTAGDMAATTFGLRCNNKWQFAYLSYKLTKRSVVAPAYEHFGVFDFNGKKL